MAHCPVTPCIAKPTHRAAGFTLIELMIAVVVVAILAAIAIPSYLDSVRKSRRSDAHTALTAVQQAQERWRANNPWYATNGQLTLGVNASPAGLGINLGLNATTVNGYYTVVISSPTASLPSAAGYTVIATAVSDKSQANDGNCVQLQVRVAGGNIFFGSAPADGTTFNESSDNRCWVR